MQKENIRYHNFHVKDFNPPEPKGYDAIWNKVTALVTEGKTIGIHCGAGDGRTGSVLASIKIRADLERFAIEDPEKITHFSDQKTSKVPVTLYGVTTLVECTSTVKEAVELIRKTRDKGGLIEPGFGDNGSGSVETKEDVEKLCLYEAWIIEKLKPTAAAKSTKQKKNKLGTLLSLFFEGKKHTIPTLLMSSSERKEQLARKEKLSTKKNKLGTILTLLFKGKKFKISTSSESSSEKKKKFTKK